MVLDPFVGSGTTLAVAKKLRRNYLGFEISKDYVSQSRKRLQRSKQGAPLEGLENPLASTAKSPLQTNNGPGHVASKRTKQRNMPVRKIHGLDEVSRRIVTAFESTHNGLSTDRVIADPELNHWF